MSTEKVSGKTRDGRTELKTILDFITKGDTLVVHKLDRLGRSTRDVLNIVHELDQSGAYLRVLDRDIDTSKPEGRLILTVLSMVAEMELAHIKDGKDDWRGQSFHTEWGSLHRRYPDLDLMGCPLDGPNLLSNERRKLLGALVEALGSPWDS